MLIFFLSSILSLCPQLHHYSPTPSLPPLLLNFAILIIRRVNLTTHFKLQRDPPKTRKKSWKKKKNLLLPTVKLAVLIQSIDLFALLEQTTDFSLQQQQQLQRKQQNLFVLTLRNWKYAARNGLYTKNQSDRKLRALFDFHNTELAVNDCYLMRKWTEHNTKHSLRSGRRQSSELFQPFSLRGYRSSCLNC